MHCVLGWPVSDFVGCDKRQRRHTMTGIRCACALLVTPYRLRIINNWSTVALRTGLLVQQMDDLLYL